MIIIFDYTTWIFNVYKYYVRSEIHDDDAPIYCMQYLFGLFQTRTLSSSSIWSINHRLIDDFVELLGISLEFCILNNK